MTQTTPLKYSHMLATESKLYIFVSSTPEGAVDQHIEIGDINELRKLYEWSLAILHGTASSRILRSWLKETANTEKSDG